MLDAQTPRAVELTWLQDTMRQEWTLGPDFKLVARRNKEIDTVLSRLEELAFRTAGQFDTLETQHLEEMFLISKDFDTFDRAYIKQDRQSLNTFINHSNSYDGRI